MSKPINVTLEVTLGDELIAKAVSTTDDALVAQCDDLLNRYPSAKGYELALVHEEGEYRTELVIDRKR